MNLSIYADNRHFLVSVNGQPLDLSAEKQPAVAIVDEGSVIRISTDYEREFTVGPYKDAIGIFFEEPDLRFQNIYCIVPDCGKTTHGALKVMLDGAGGKADDDYPYVTAPAHVSCPDIIDGNWWHFLPSLPYMKKMDTAAFRMMEKFYIIGFAFAKTIWKGYDYKIYQSIDKFKSTPNTVGIAYDYATGAFALVERDKDTDGLIATDYEDVDAFYQMIKDRL